MDIYREDIMDHYENPRNMGSFDSALDKEIVEGRDSNASCGDMIQFQLKIQEGIIADVKWKGTGCAISTAAASKLSVYLQGQTLKAVKKLTEDELLNAGVGIEVNPGRKKCLMLPVTVVTKLLVEVEIGKSV